MAKGKVSTRTFVAYLTTAGPKRLSVVSKQVAYKDKPFPGDPYARLYSAMASSVRLNDPAPVWAAVSNESTRMRASYGECAEGWEQIVPAFHGAVVERRHTGVWSARRITVNVTPHLRLSYPDGRRELVWIHARAEKPDPLEIDAVLWLLEQAADDLLQNAEPVFVDVRRARLIRRRPSQVTTPWMEAEAAGFAELLDQVATSAA
jgi:hypothetical protein